jgi:hypothetical protein
LEHGGNPLGIREKIINHFAPTQKEKCKKSLSLHPFKKKKIRPFMSAC